MTKKLGWAAVLLYLLVYLIPLSFRPLSLSDEARYAEIPREMIESGDWVVPRLNNVRYFEKPPLGYWLTALAVRVLGQNHFAVRLPSAAAVGLTALLLYWLVRRETGRPLQAILSSVLYMTSLLVVVVGVTGVLDSLLTLFCTGALVFFLAADRDDAAPRRRNAWLGAFGLCCALGFLVKGFLGFAVPVVAIIPYMLWERRFLRLFRFALLPMLVAFLVILPWGLAIHLRENDFWRYFFWVEHVQRFMSDDPQHPGPFWYFVPLLIGGVVPWTFILPAAALGFRREDGANRLVRYSVCWLVMPFLFFSVSRGKLPTYILPCFPPLGILAAHGLLSYFKSERLRAFNAGAGVLAACLAAGAAGLLITQGVPSIPGKLYSVHEGYAWLALLAALVVSCGAVLASLRARSPERKLLLYGLVPAVLVLFLPHAIPDRIRATRSAEAFLERHADRVPADSILVSDANRFHAACWFFKRNDVYVLGNGGELEYGLQYENARHRLLDVAKLQRIIRRSRGRQVVILFTCKDRYLSYKHHLPVPTFEEIDSTIEDDLALVFVQF